MGLTMANKLTAASWQTASAAHSAFTFTISRHYTTWRQFGPGHRLGPESPVWSHFYRLAARAWLRFVIRFVFSALAIFNFTF